MRRRILPACTWAFASLACHESTRPGDGTDRTPHLEIVLSQSAIRRIPGTYGIGPSYSPYVYVPFTIQRGGYAGNITITVHAANSVSAAVSSFDQASQPPSGVLAVLVPVGTPIGDHTVRITAREDDGREATADLTVTAVPFLMRAIAPLLTVSQGATGEVSISWTGATPSLSVSGAGPGVTITPSANSRYLDVVAAPDAELGSRPVIVAATAQGSMETRTFQLVVQSARPRRQIAFRVCWHTDVAPDWLAYANDGERWTRITPDADGFVRFDATERVSFATRMSYIGGYAISSIVRVIQTTATELEEMQCPAPGTGSKTVAVRVSNADRYLVALNTYRFTTERRDGVIPYGSSMHLGPQDLVASGRRAATTGTEWRGIIRRAVDPASGDTIVVDFTGADAFVLDSAAHGVTPESGRTTFLLSRLHTATTIGVLLPTVLADGGGMYRAIPSDRLAAGDIQSLMLLSTLYGATNSYQWPVRGSLTYFRSAGVPAASLGPDVAHPTADTTTGVVTLPLQPEYPDLAGIRQRIVTDWRGVWADVEVWQTRSVAGNDILQWTFRIPDLGRMGYVEPLNGTNLVGAAAAGKASLFFGGTPASGTVLKWAAEMGWFLPFPSGL